MKTIFTIFAGRKVYLEILFTYLDRLLEKRTALVIAHRLATVESSDRILVMKKGRLIEQGSHEELRALGGLYSQLADLQEKGLTTI